MGCGPRRVLTFLDRGSILRPSHGLAWMKGTKPMASNQPLTGATAAAIENQIRTQRVVAILRLADPSRAVDVCRALADGGLTVMEITVNHPESIRSLERARETLDDRVALGAGTVLDVATVRRVRDAGAAFCVSPDLDPGVVAAAHACGLLPIPGVFSPTEAVAAHRLGLNLLKLFPAEPVGVAYLRALRAPFPAIGFIPTGGVEVDAVRTWLEAGAAAVALGTGLVGHGDDLAGVVARTTQLVSLLENIP